MEKKYILTDATMTHKGRTLHRVQAVRDFGYIKTGELGGWIESEENLSHDGLCWIFRNAKVYDNAKVYNNAWIYSNVAIYDNAEVYGNARVCDDALVYDDARVCGNALVCNNARVCCNALVLSNAEICRNAFIASPSDYLVVGPIGSRDAFTTFYRTRDGIRVSCGCFDDSIEEFEKKVKEVHWNSIHYPLYFAACGMATLSLNRRKNSSYNEGGELNDAADAKEGKDIVGDGD